MGVYSEIFDYCINCGQVMFGPQLKKGCAQYFVEDRHIPEGLIDKVVEEGIVCESCGHGHKFRKRSVVVLEPVRE